MRYSFNCSLFIAPLYLSECIGSGRELNSCEQIFLPTIRRFSPAVDRLSFSFAEEKETRDTRRGCNFGAALNRSISSRRALTVLLPTEERDASEYSSNGVRFRSFAPVLQANPFIHPSLRNLLISVAERVRKRAQQSFRANDIISVDKGPIRKV